MTIAKPLLPFLQKKKRYKIAIGGRGSTKSMTVGDICLMDAQTKGIKTVCLREFQSEMGDSVHALLASEIERLDLKGFECQKTAILYNSVEMFRFRGMSRNPGGLRSMHGFDRAWVEEAQMMSYESLESLTPTIRKAGSEIWMTANLRSMKDAFSQRFFKPFEKELRKHGYYEDEDHLIVWINYDQSPFFPEVLEKERRFDLGRLSKAEYGHKWLGELYDEVAGSIIPVEWFDAAIDAHERLDFKATGAMFAAFDPSDNRGDAQGFACRKGSVYLDICEYTEGDVNEGTDWAMDRALSLGAHHFTWDVGGMGTGLKQQVAKRLTNTPCEYHQFNGAEKAEHPKAIYQPVQDEAHKERRSNQDTFVNKRAQGYYKLADRFERTYLAIQKVEAGVPPINFNPDDCISLSSDIKALDQLRSEVCRIPRKPNNNGKKQIMTKLEMSKKPYELPSPNMADCMMMAEFVPKQQVTARPLNQGAFG